MLAVKVDVNHLKPSFGGVGGQYRDLGGLRELNFSRNLKCAQITGLLTKKK